MKTQRLSPGEPTCVKRNAITHACLKWSDGRSVYDLRGAGVMKGTWCETRLKASVDKRSYRWIKRGPAWILIGCPKGKWKTKAAHCTVGTRAVAILKPAKSGRCPRGRRRVKKG